MRRRPSSSTAPVLHFALSGLLVLAIVGLVAVRLVEHEARDEALHEAEGLTRLAAEGIVAPEITPPLLRGDPAAVARLDRVVRARVLRAPVVRVKLWRADGTILWSDERRLGGERDPLGDEERAALRRGGVQADLSDLRKPENRFERGFHQLREVYLGVAVPGGGRVLYEEYLRGRSLTASGSRIRHNFLPILLGALLLLELTQLPLASSMARRLRRGQREREELLGRAVSASENERRRIARDLHDGVVQDLAGVSFRLGAAAAELRAGRGDAVSAVEDAGSRVRGSIRRLRSLLVDLYPETLHRQGLHRAMSDLLAGLEAEQIATRLDFDETMHLDAAREALVFRVAQEALRNVSAHADARHVAVRFGPEEGAAVLEVRDDGSGLPPDEVPGDAARPRFGLRMLDDLAREYGARLDVDSVPAGGTTLRLTVPEAT